MKENKALLVHILTKNEKTEQWVAEDPDNRWASTLVTDLDHWAEMGVTTPDELDHYLVECDHWELYRDIHGIKPRWIDYSKLTTAEIEEMIQQELRDRAAAIEAARAEKARLENLKRDAFDVEKHSKEMHSLGKAFEDLMLSEL